MANYPLINGTKHSWSQVEVATSKGTFIGVTELTYSDELAPGEVRATSPQIIARTTGEYSTDGSLTMLLEDGHELIAELTTATSGFKETIFQVTVMYSATGTSTVITDRLIGCRITGTEGGGSQGPDPLTITFGLHIMRIEWNGNDPLSGMLK
jgi:hypothetical protein